MGLAASNTKHISSMANLDIKAFFNVFDMTVELATQQGQAASIIRLERETSVSCDGVQD